MSVQKFVIGSKKCSFTTFTNEVLQGLNNYEALGMYAYLLSLPAGWEFYKEQLAAHGNIGRDKTNKLLKILQEHNLVKISQVRDEKGQFAHFDLQVLDGTSFKINDITEIQEPFTEKPLTDNQLLVNSSYKENINKTNINKNKSFYASRNSENPKQKQKQKRFAQKSENEIKHDWAPMKNEQARIDQNEVFKRVPPPIELKEIIQKIKRRAMTQ